MKETKTSPLKHKLSKGPFPQIRTASQSPTARKPATPQADGAQASPARTLLTLYIHFAQGASIWSPKAAIKLRQQRKKVKQLDTETPWNLHIYNPFTLRGRPRTQILISPSPVEQLPAQSRRAQGARRGRELENSGHQPWPTACGPNSVRNISRKRVSIASLVK